MPHDEKSCVVVVRIHRDEAGWLFYNLILRQVFLCAYMLFDTPEANPKPSELLFTITFAGKYARRQRWDRQ